MQAAEHYRAAEAILAAVRQHPMERSETDKAVLRVDGHIISTEIAVAVAQVHASLAQAAIASEVAVKGTDATLIADTLNATQAAREMNVDANHLRYFLRDQGRGVGCGQSYALRKDELLTLRARFLQWQDGRRAS